jgi:hypothetical protein
VLTKFCPEVFLYFSWAAHEVTKLPYGALDGITLAVAWTANQEYRPWGRQPRNNTFPPMVESFNYPSFDRPDQTFLVGFERSFNGTITRSRPREKSIWKQLLLRDACVSLLVIIHTLFPQFLADLIHIPVGIISRAL